MLATLLILQARFILPDFSPPAWYVSLSTSSLLRKWGSWEAKDNSKKITCGKVDANSVRMIGRTMSAYLVVQATFPCDW